MSADQLDADMEELLDTHNAMTRVLLGAGSDASERQSGLADLL